MRHTRLTTDGTAYTDWLGELSRQRQARRAEEGMYAGKPVNGYLRVPGGGPHVVDESKRLAIRRLFSEARTKGFRKLMDIAFEEGLSNASGGTLGLSSLHNMLTNPFYAGMVKSEGRLVAGKHKSIISLAEFESAQQELKKRKC